MDIKDRGNKKWTSIMIPELREELAKLFEPPKPERPELDEQEVERLNRALTHAFRAGQPVIIKYWDDGEREVCGRIVWFEMGKLRIVGDNGKTNINTNDIIRVDFLGTNV